MFDRDSMTRNGVLPRGSLLGSYPPVDPRKHPRGISSEGSLVLSQLERRASTEALVSRNGPLFNPPGKLPSKGQAFRLLMLGDVVGRPGREVLRELVPRLRSELDLDMVIANGENAAGGAGIDPKTGLEIRHAGVDVVTLGDHTFQRKGSIEFLDAHSEWCIRPLNFPPDTPGAGCCTFSSPSGVHVTVVNLIGRVFINGPFSCPFRAFQQVASETPIGKGHLLVVDMHAEATSEKCALGRLADGKASLVAGTHTHVQTSDARILPEGTAYITDLGMCGSSSGVIGMRTDAALGRFLRATPSPYQIAEGLAELNGVVVDFDPVTGHGSWIGLLREADRAETVSEGSG